MKVKRTILHIIDSLALGGAEQLLVGTINSLTEYNNIVVTLVEDGPLKDGLKSDKHYCLHYKSKASLIRAVKQLRSIIKENKVDIVHSHLFWSTIIARLATPAKVKHIFTIHSTLSLDAFKHSLASKLLEQFTYKASQTAIFVSNFVKEDYKQHIKLTGNSYVLHNFIPDRFFTNKKPGKLRPLRNLVAIGSLKAAKNYHYLIEVFRLLKQKGIPVTLDIYGDGQLKAELQTLIDDSELPIRLMGVVQDVTTILPDYDGYVLCSLHEGFGLAPMEAMAFGLPAFLSDIPILHEISGGNAVFFDPTIPESFVKGIDFSLKNPTVLESNVAHAFEFANRLSRKANYLEKLKGIYTAVLAR